MLILPFMMEITSSKLIHIYLYLFFFSPLPLFNSEFHIYSRILLIQHPWDWMGARLLNGTYTVSYFIFIMKDLRFFNYHRHEFSVECVAVNHLYSTLFSCTNLDFQGLLLSLDAIKTLNLSLYFCIL